MKTWRAASLIAYIVGLVTATVIFTMPIRSPDSVISWQSIGVFLVPLVVLLCLLPLRQHLDHSRYSRVLALAAFLFVALGALGYMALPILGISLAAALGLFVASNAQQHEHADV